MIDWIKLIIILSGGLALFLYGMNLMSEGLNEAAGKGIRNILHSFTKNRFASFLTGTISTTLIQSSSAVSVMTISLVKARLLTFHQTFGILLGAGIGTTITAQIIAFKITDYSLLFIAIGFFINIIAKQRVLKFAGSALLGFGLLFYGLHLMSEAMSPLRTHEPFINLLVQLENPFLGILAGFIFTALIQSSSAFIGILIVLASQGLLSLEAGIPLLLGANIGTPVTAFIASLNAGYESKRVALAFFLINLIGVLIVCWWIQAYADFISSFTQGKIEGNLTEYSHIPRQIANAHTVFNVMVTILLIPLTNTLTKWIEWVIPARKPKKILPVDIQYLDKKMLKKPALAISLAKKEVMIMAEYVKEMLGLIIHPFVSKDTSQLQQIEQNEQKVDFLMRKISAYSTKISQKQIDEDIANEAFQIIYVISELEEIGDIISRTLLFKAKSWVESKKDFSDAGKKELLGFHFHTVEYLEKAMAIFDDYNKKALSKLKKEHKKYRNLADDLKQKHFERLGQNIPASIKSSKIHMDVMGALRAIHSHIANIVRIMVG